MDYKPIVRMRDVAAKQMNRERHAKTRERQPLKISIRRHAQELLRGRLTTRDIEIVRALIGVGMLTRHQIQRIFFNNSHKSASHRLTKLYHYHFLDRNSYWLTDMRADGLQPCFIYTIGATGLEAFAQRMGMARSQIPFNPARYTLTRDDHFLLHDLRISEMFTQLRLHVRREEGELIWFNEAASMVHVGQEEIVRPDGLGVLLSGGREAAFFVEMDRGHTDWAHKVKAYDQAYQSNVWRRMFKISGWQPTAYPPVLCVVPDGLLEKARETIGQERPMTEFYIKGWSAFLAEETLCGWYRLRTGTWADLRL